MKDLSYQSLPQNTGHQRGALHTVQAPSGRRSAGSLRELVGNSTSDLRIEVISPRKLPASTAPIITQKHDERENGHELCVGETSACLRSLSLLRKYQRLQWSFPLHDVPRPTFGCSRKWKHRIWMSLRCIIRLQQPIGKLHACSAAQPSAPTNGPHEVAHASRSQSSIQRVKNEVKPATFLQLDPLLSLQGWGRLIRGQLEAPLHSSGR